MLKEHISSELDNTICSNFTTISSYAKHNSIKHIFLDNYNYIINLYSSGKLLPSTLKSIQMMLLCSTHYLGYSLYECPNCGNQHAIHNTCKSRFCNKCGMKYARQRASHVSSICLDVKHRHIVFTIPEQLRSLFAKRRDLLDLLFIASRNTMVSLFNKNYLNKQVRKAKKNHTVFKYHSDYLFKDSNQLNKFAAISTLHTFGRDLKFSPHIHMLVAEAYYDPKKDKMVNFNYFNYAFLRKAWQYQLLQLLRDHLSYRFHQFLYHHCKDGFYVYAKDDKDNHAYNDSDDEADSTFHSKHIEKCMEYALRYTGRPAMAESRITNYDDLNNTVEWFYTPHENEEETVVVKDNAKDFICKLLIHIPRPNFRMVRYYGLYANTCHELLSHVHCLLNKNIMKATKSNRDTYKQQLNEKLMYRNLLISSFGIDPLLCPCGTIMEYVETYDPFDNNGKKVVMDDGYRNDCINEMRKMPLSRRRSFMDSRGIAFHGYRHNKVN